MSRLIRIPIYGLIIAVGLSLFTWSLHAGVQLDIVAKIQNADPEFDVVTVIGSEVEASRNKVALLGIANPSRSSFSFRLEEWLLLIELWTKAGEGAVGFLESRQLDGGDGNRRRLSSHGECRAWGQVRHQFSEKKHSYIRSSEGRHGWLRESSLPSEGFSIAIVVNPQYLILSLLKNLTHGRNRGGFCPMSGWNHPSLLEWMKF
jgi:hypothetical protein